MRPMTRRIACLIAVITGATASTTRAAIVDELDSTGFAYKYEMDVAPSIQDLDNNGTGDWFGSGVPTVSGGFAANTAQNQLFRGDFSGSIWRLIADTADAEWTFEIRLAKTGGTQGSSGWFGIAHANNSESNSSTMGIKDDRVVFNGADYLDPLPKS